MKLDRFKRLIITLVQALTVGGVSPNFRCVWVEAEEERFVLHIILETEDPEDREEIEELKGEISALLYGVDEMDFEIRVTITGGPIELPPQTNRDAFCLFKRKEDKLLEE